MIKTLQLLMDELEKLPGVGPKWARRFALYILTAPAEEVVRLAKSIVYARKKIRECPICGGWTEERICSICTDETRDRSKICVVEDPLDVLTIEKTKVYNGLYHVLGGLISPSKGVGPEELRIRELLKRITPDIQEIILALNPNSEGEATASFLTELLAGKIKVTRIAYGLPIGGDIDYADDMTLKHAFAGRWEVKK